MRTSAGGCWLAVGLSFGCGPAPSEVIGPYDGSGGSSGSATGGPSSGEPGTGSTGPIAEGSADSGTGMPTGDTGTTAPVDPVTTDPDTSGDPPTTESSSGDPGSSSSGDPPDPPPTCQELFGAANGYTPCMEDDTSCTFALNSNGSTCNQVCGSFGQPCIGGIDNPGGLECTSQGPLTCDQFENGTTICICAK